MKNLIVVENLNYSSIIIIRWLVISDCSKYLSILLLKPIEKADPGLRKPGNKISWCKIKMVHLTIQKYCEWRFFSRVIAVPLLISIGKASVAEPFN